MRFQLALILLVCSTCYAGKILAIFPVLAKSHTILVEPTLERLARLGHEVTHITVHPRKGLPAIPNYKEIDISSTLKMVEFNTFQLRNMSLWTKLTHMQTVMTSISHNLLHHPEVVKLIQSENRHFDAVFSDNMMTHAAMAGFAHKYKAPLIVMCSTSANPYAHFLVGNPWSVAYIPDTMLGEPQVNTFFLRLKNFFKSSMMYLILRLSYLPTHDRQMRESFGPNLPPIEDILRNTSLVLVNHHASISHPRPLLPNMVEVLGMHVKHPMLIPVEVKKFLDESKEGVILFSLGSLSKSEDMPDDRLQELLKAFSKLKLNVLWKYEKDQLEGQPKNVKIWKWLPQNNVLAHPHLKLFITHGGLLSTTEAIYRGVPIVGLPLGGDQVDNMKLAEHIGIGKMVDFDTFTADELVDTINEVLNNPSYRRNIEMKSELVKDTPMNARDRAVYWIEYVMRNKGAPHLRSAAQDLNFFQLHSLDVLAFLAICLFISLHITIFTGKLICKKICRRKVSETKKKN